MANSSLMDTLFQRTLEDLIKGIRLQLITESAFISKAMEEIRREIKTTDPHTKSIALLKLSFLNSIHGIDMSWAAFHVVEVMSSSRFAYKKIGYLAASQSFTDSTSVLLLITNQLRKDLSSTNEFEVGLALECLSRIATIDLARDLTPEIYTLLSTSKIFVRKKAIGVVLRVFEKYPDAVKVCFKRLVENMESSDPQTVSAAVGVFCELVSKDANLYLPLAPEFYRILVDSKNNWVLIKVLKIFSKLVQLEPRLAKKVVEPICDHMRRTGAKSLMFECIRTVVSSLTDFESALKLAAVKIRELLVDDDPNLKYLGLQALTIVAPTHLWVVLDNKEVVIKSLSDGDPNIKLESLRLVMAMVSDSNVAEISRVLVNYALKSDPEFCNEILGNILSTCSRNVYEIVIDFDWYVSLLGEISRIPHCQKGEDIEYQLIDIGMRVKDVRPELIRVSRDLLIDPALLGNPFLHRVLSAAAWVSGEYIEFSRNPSELMEALLQPRTSLLPPLIRAVYIQSAFKVLIFCLHSYILQRESTSISTGNNLPSGETQLVSERTLRESSDLAAREVPSDCEQYEGFNQRISNQTDGVTIENDGDITANGGQTFESSLESNNFTHESIVNLLDLLELGLGPLSGSLDVEIHERVGNVLGFIELIKQTLHESYVQTAGDINVKELKLSSIIQLMHVAFSKELGPVSVIAQERVPVPDGLILKENLGDLEIICGDIQLPLLDSLSLASPEYGESLGFGQSNLQSKEYSEPLNESTSLLSEHRKRHGLYYLPSEKNEIVSNDYPPAHDPRSCDIANNDADNLVKLTEQSLIPNKKPSNSKPRPMVVKLDGDGVPVAAKKQELKDDSLSSAVREILAGNETAMTQPRSKPSAESSSNTKGKEKLNTGVHPEAKENMGATVKPDHGNPTSRRSKHCSHGKERRHRSPAEKNAEEREENGQKGKHKSNSRHGRHKARQRTEGPLNVVAQSPVIQDFLL